MFLATIPVRCHTCGIKFNSRQLPVITDTGIRNSELRQDFEGLAEQFEPYVICTCPSCGKADWFLNFQVTQEVAVLNQPNTTPHLQYRAAALAAEKNGGEFYNIGLFYLHAAWCADDARAYPQAREYRKFAADAFSKSLMDISCPEDLRSSTEYLIGELYRKAGEFEKCKAYFNQIIGKLPASYAYMARKVTKLATMSNMDSIRFESDRLR
jgi:tetratricopeptide (TPR) repeat protein